MIAPFQLWAQQRGTLCSPRRASSCSAFVANTGHRYQILSDPFRRRSAGTRTTYHHQSLKLTLSLSIGLIWRLNPSMMPHAFCVGELCLSQQVPKVPPALMRIFLAQTTLMQASWACITGVCAVVSLSTASRVLTTKARVLQW